MKLSKEEGRWALQAAMAPAVVWCDKTPACPSEQKGWLAQVRASPRLNEPTVRYLRWGQKTKPHLVGKQGYIILICVHLLCNLFAQGSL